MSALRADEKDRFWRICDVREFAYSDFIA